MTRAARRCVEAHGFAVRDLPVPLHTRAHAAALVAPGYDALDLRGRPRPVLDVASAADPATAAWQLAAAAARLRTPGAAAVAAAADLDTAVVRAVYAGLARRAAVGDRPPRRITGWGEAVPGVWHHPADVAGSVDCYLLGDVAGVPAVGALARLDDDPRWYAAVACDLSVPAAVAAALDGVRRKLAVAGLRDAAGAPASPVPSWCAPADLPPPAADVPLATMRSAAASRAELRETLRQAGVRAAVRVLGRDPSAAVVWAQLDPAETPDPPATRDRPATRNQSATATRDRPATWDPPDCPALDLRAPTQLSLGFDRHRVEAGRVYHEHSKIRAGFSSLPVVDLTDMGAPTRRLIGRAFRDFRHARRRYPLRPEPERPLAGLREAVGRRRSWAAMADAPIDRAALATLLRLTYGVTGSGAAGSDVTLPLRATPAAGGLYAVDLFLLVHRVDGVAPGLYYVHPALLELQLVRGDARVADLAALTGYGARARQAAAVVIYVAALRRTQWKYGERGYRMALLDCGHLAQSVVLTATALGLVAHPMVAFVDDGLNRLVGVDGTDDAALYLTLLAPAVGAARPEEAP